MPRTRRALLNASVDDVRADEELNVMGPGRQDERLGEHAQLRKCKGRRFNSMSKGDAIDASPLIPRGGHDEPRVSALPR